MSQACLRNTLGSSTVMHNEQTQSPSRKVGKGQTPQTREVSYFSLAYPSGTPSLEASLQDTPEGQELETPRRGAQEERARALVSHSASDARICREAHGKTELEGEFILLHHFEVHAHEVSSKCSWESVHRWGLPECHRMQASRMAMPRAWGWTPPSRCRQQGA